MGELIAVHYCSLCSKSVKEVEIMIAGPRGINICDECVTVCAEIIENHRNEKAAELAAREQAKTP